MQVRDKEQHVLGDGIFHPGARPMEVFLDKNGCLWLCDKGIDPKKGYEGQGCWRCQDLQFTRND